jgi:hypothetical protein
MALLVSLVLLVEGSWPSFAEIVLEHASSVGVGNEPVDIAAGDIDGDGDQDLVVTNLSGHSFTILYNNGHGDFSQREEVRLPGDRKAPDTIGLGDFNGDGRMDIAVGILSEVDPLIRQFMDQGMLILLAQPDGSYPDTFIQVEGSPGLIVPVDYNEDGAVDIALANLGILNFSNPFSISVEGAGVGLYLNQGNGVFALDKHIETNGSISPMEFVDVNGDKNLDIVATNQGALNVLTGQLEGYNITIMTNDGAGSFVPTDALTCSTFPFSAAAGDFDGDGDVDVIAAEQGVATLYGVVPESAGIGYWWNQGTGTFADETYVKEQGVPTMIKAADFDRDGDQDFVLTNSGMDIVEGSPTNPALTVFENDGAGTFKRVMVLAVGEEPNSMALGDWNGDGAVDIAVASKGNNLVNIFLNKSPGTQVRDWIIH